MFLAVRGGPLERVTQVLSRRCQSHESFLFVLVILNRRTRACTIQLYGLRAFRIYVLRSESSKLALASVVREHDSARERQEITQIWMPRDN